MNQAFDNLAILIPTRNRAGDTGHDVGKLQNAGLGEVPLWIYDDCSADATAIPKAVAGWPGVRVITGEQRVGQAEGRNVLMRACGKEFGLFLDDDSFPRSSAGLQKHLVHQPELRRAVVTFQYMDVPTQRYSTPLDLPEGIARSFQGGGSLFHIPTVLGLGGFRSFFIYGYEEPELSCRLQMNGFHIWYEPSMVVLHNHFETPAEFRNHAEYHYLYARNSVLMSSLNMPLWLGRSAWSVPCGAPSFNENFSGRKFAGLLMIWQSFALEGKERPVPSHGQRIGSNFPEHVRDK